MLQGADAGDTFMNGKSLTIALLTLDPAWQLFAFYLKGQIYQLTSGERIHSYSMQTHHCYPTRLNDESSSVLSPYPILSYWGLVLKLFFISITLNSPHIYFLSSATQVSVQISTCMAGIFSWIAAHQLKLNSSKPELLYIPRDTSPCQDLVISLDKSQISPSVTAHNLGETMENHLSFLPCITTLTKSCQFFLLHWEDHW